ncbi:hypothetical protein ABEB36_007142 [Hypothenemus hampei]|uniref:beta-mannosidase n=1 Tax=Hypothenemus hampei TaxID=57062 RepID=A0ABD1ET26_HYPHA
MNLEKILVFSIFLFYVQAKKALKQSLGGSWTAVTETFYKYDLPASVPGGIYSDLMKQGIIDDIFSSYNDNDTKWVGASNWTYSYNFTVNPNFFNYEHVNLVFEGVDTVADVELNDIRIGTTRNMFKRYIFDIKKHLKADGNNTLRLYFANAPNEALNLNKEQNNHYRIPWECPPEQYHGICHINMLRKMQASFAWDWGPAFASLGIWKPVYLEAYDDALIRDLVVRVEKAADDENYLLLFDVYFANNSQGFLNGTIGAKLYMGFENIYKNFDVQEKVNERGEILKTVSLSVDIPLIRLWYPNGYGDQPLYKTVIYFNSHLDNAVTNKIRKIGFRFVELVQEPLEKGATFYVKVNDVPIFIKGSNEIPINILPEEGQNRRKTRTLLQNAKDVNMNMLRVWGGGVYESDYFYEVADELGIMIWQDFMFACSLYPANEAYLTSVEDEVDFNLKRIYSHPSIVIYAGNNENEGVLADNWYNTADNYTQYKKDYVALYIDTIKTQFDRISKGKGVFVSSSPTNGKLTESQGWVGDSPSNQFWGDVHYYNYILDPWNSNTYPIPRFCSEYGYQSIPFEDSWKTAMDVNFSVSDPLIKWRQHHPIGTSEMALLIAQNLKFPDAYSSNYSREFVYLSQVYAAQAIKIETEHYRRYRSYLTDDGRGYTMGALFWQLNDVWVAPTWSSIDYTGRWKMLHYFAKHFFHNIIITGHISITRELDVYVVNDQLSPVENVNVLFRVYRYDSIDFQPVYEDRLQANLTASASQLLRKVEIDNLFEELNCTLTSCFFYYVIQKNASLTDNVAISPENYIFPGKLKHSSLATTTVQIVMVTKLGPKSYQITVNIERIALFVWLDSHAIMGKFSENGYLQVQSNRTIYFDSCSDITADELKEALTVTHLKDPNWS